MYRLMGGATLLALIVMVTSVQAQDERQRQRGARGQDRAAGAQGRGFQGRGGFGQTQTLLTLAGNPAVQEEVGATAEQKEKLGQLAAEYRESAPRLDFQALQDLAQEERAAKMREYQEKTAAAGKKLEPKVAEILNEKQVARVNQIRVQAMGAMAFRDEAIGKELGISDEQSQKILAAVRELMSEARGGGAEGIQEKMMAAAKEALNAEQRAKYEKMLGEPFDMSKLRTQGRRGAGRDRNID